MPLSRLVSYQEEAIQMEAGPCGLPGDPDPFTACISDHLTHPDPAAFQHFPVDDVLDSYLSSQLHPLSNLLLAQSYQVSQSVELAQQWVPDATGVFWNLKKKPSGAWSVLVMMLNQKKNPHGLHQETLSPR